MRWNARLALLACTVGALATSAFGAPTKKGRVAGPPKSEKRPVDKPARYDLGAMRLWARGTVTRIVIDAPSPIVNTGELHDPERIYFDLEDTLPAGTKFRTVAGAGIVRKIRMAPTQGTVTRVAVDLTEPAEFELSRLVNPARLVIEVRPAGTARPGSVSASKAKDNEMASVSLQTKRPKLQLKKFALPPPPPMPKTPVISPSKIELAKLSQEEWLAKLPPPPGWTFPRVLPPAKPKKSVAVASRKAAPVKGKTPVAAKVESPPLDPTLLADHVDPPIGEPASDVETTLTRALGLKLRRVVLDAGHGGKDVGTISPHGMYEKDLVLDVTHRLGKLIEDKLASEVVYTRADDRFIPLGERTAIANREKADLFLSIHANSSRGASAAGFETYYLNVSAPKADMDVAARENASSERTIADLTDLVKQIMLNDKLDESRQFAGHVHDATYPLALKTIGTVRDRGVKKAPFMVLIGARMPSVLVEIGFMTNPTEEAQMKKPEYRQKIAEALFNGVSSYADTLSHFAVASNANAAALDVGN